jgi:hypothetical protein
MNGAHRDAIEPPASDGDDLGAIAGSPLVPLLDSAHRPGRDLVWCATFALAWRELEALLGGPVRPVGAASSPRASALAEALSREAASLGGAADPASCFAAAGRQTPEDLARIFAEVAARFGSEAAPALLPDAPAENAFFAYSHLAGSWAFPAPFLRFEGLLPFGGAPVATFGLRPHALATEAWRERARNVRVAHHRYVPEATVGEAADSDDPAEEFVVELLPARPEVSIAIARCAPKTTLAGTVAWAMERLRAPAPADGSADLREDERFEVPCVGFDLRRSWSELHGLAIGSPAGPAGVLGDFAGRARFHLDEGGARLASEAFFGGLALPPRYLVCDGPFLVMLVRRDAAGPFFAAWIETNDLLVKPA